MTTDKKKQDQSHLPPTIHARVSQENYDKLLELAKINGRSASNMVNRLIEVAEIKVI